MEEFLSDALLYEKRIIFTNYSADNNGYSTPFHFIGQTFEYYCEKELKNTTFKLGTEHDHSYSYASIPEEYFNGEYLDFTFSALNVCQSCNDHQVYFLLNVSSDKPITDVIDMSRMSRFTERSNTDIKNANILIQKVGAYPELRIKLDNQVNKFFDREASGFYYKGIKAINDNYGIGALAYFRRIVERELIHLIEVIKDLPDANKPMIQNLIDEHSKNPSVSTIYSSIFEYLPNSLRILGDNPIKLLYNQTSEGLHSMTESESLHKAKNILRLLEFVILKIYEERSTVKDIKEIMKELKSENKIAP